MEREQFFYPRPCVAKYLDQKERRYREPDVAMYHQREFIANSFVLNHVYNYNCLLALNATITVVHLLHYILSY